MKAYQRLVNGLTPLSYRKDKELLSEWYIVPLVMAHREKCACGKAGLVHNFQIKNIITGREIIVGSECIHHFENDEMEKVLSTLQWTKQDRKVRNKSYDMHVDDYVKQSSFHDEGDRPDVNAVRAWAKSNYSKYWRDKPVKKVDMVGGELLF